jgi:hypothetical protein
MREVAQGLVLDLALFPIRAPEEMGLIHASFVDASRRGYMNPARSSCHAVKIATTRTNVKQGLRILVATKCICDIDITPFRDKNLNRKWP